MSNKGRILWSAPSDEDAVTFEEITLPSECSGIEQQVLDLDTPTDTHWRKFLRCLDVETDSEEAAADSPRAQCGYTGVSAGMQRELKSTAVAQATETSGSIEDVVACQARVESRANDKQ